MINARGRTFAPGMAMALSALPGMLGMSASAARAEVIEAVVARVNDDIITKTELADAEQESVAEIYSRHTGEGLDKELARTRTDLLKDMITKKLLVQQAERLYDMSKMQDAFLRELKANQKIASNAELEKLLQAENMTVEDFKRKLVEVNAPGYVVQYEVRDKIAVSDGEIEAFYETNSGLMASPEKVSFREIVLLIEGRPREQVLGAGRSLAERARAGEDFETIAKESSIVEGSGRGALLGPFQRGELAPELEKAVFAMTAGEVSDPIESGYSVHVVRVETHEAAVLPSLDAMKDKITQQLERQKFNTRLEEYIHGLWGKSDIHVDEGYLERLPVAYRKYLR